MVAELPGRDGNSVFCFREAQNKKLGGREENANDDLLQ